MANSRNPNVTDILDIPWRISTQAVSNEVGKETVILHLGNEAYYGLNETGTQLWKGLKGGALPRAICDQIVRAYAIEDEQVEKDLRELLEGLVANNLIVDG